MHSQNLGQQHKANSKSKICKNCFNCKTRNGEIYCKEGNFKEKSSKTIIYTPVDFDCCEWEED